MNFEDHADMFVRPVQNQDDLFAFQYGFNLQGKALDDGTTAPVVSENEDGDLFIEGYAAVFDGIDREGENFSPGAFQRGIKSFLKGNNPLCYHHKADHVLGEVLDLQEHEGKGLYMKARVDAQQPTSPMRWIYDAVKKGSMKGLSVGGFFKRKMTAAGARIDDMDFSEVSITGVPVHPGTSFAVVAGKALEGLEAPQETQDAPEAGAVEVKACVDALTQIVERLEARAAVTNESASVADENTN